MQGLQLPFGYNFCIQGIQLLSCSNHQCPELDGCAGRGQHLLAPFDYSLSGGSTVLTCLQRKLLTSFRSMIPPSHCFYIFHTKQSIVQITFNHFKHPQMKSRNFPTFKMRTEEYLLQWCLLSTMVWERYVPPSLTASLLFFLLFTPLLPPINPSSHFHLPSFISSFFLPSFLPVCLPPSSY